MVHLKSSVLQLTTDTKPSAKGLGRSLPSKQFQYTMYNVCYVILVLIVYYFAPGVKFKPPTTLHSSFHQPRKNTKSSQHSEEHSKLLQIIPNISRSRNWLHINLRNMHYTQQAPQCKITSTSNSQVQGKAPHILESGGARFWVRRDGSPTTVCHSLLSHNPCTQPTLHLTNDMTQLCSRK